MLAVVVMVAYVGKRGVCESFWQRERETVKSEGVWSHSVK